MIVERHVTFRDVHQIFYPFVRFDALRLKNMNVSAVARVDWDELIEIGYVHIVVQPTLFIILISNGIFFDQNVPEKHTI